MDCTNFYQTNCNSLYLICNSNVFHEFSFYFYHGPGAMLCLGGSKDEYDTITNLRDLKVLGRQHTGIDR